MFNTRFNLRLTKQQYLDLLDIAKDGLSISEHIRRAIDDYRKKQRGKK